jgi:hypothetical protein
MPEELQHHTPTEREVVNIRFKPPVAIGPDAAKLLQPAAAVAARLAHAGLVSCRILGQLVQDPRITASLGLSVTSSNTNNSSTTTTTTNNNNTSSNNIAAAAAAASAAAGGGPGVHQSVVAAANMSVQLYHLLLKYGKNICGLSLMLSGVLPQKFKLTAAQKRAASDALKLLPPGFDRCCLAVCSWAGGLYGLWPLITMALNLLQSPTCFSPEQPFPPPWTKWKPRLWVKVMTWTISHVPCDLIALLSYIYAEKAPPSSTEPRSIAAWLGKEWDLGGGTHVLPPQVSPHAHSKPNLIFLCTV